MGMLLHRHRLERMAKEKLESAKEEVKAEEIPFTDPEEPVEEPVRKQTRNKPATVTRRRKPVK